MAEPMRIRAQMKGDICDVRVLVNHPMESGVRREVAAGTVIPPAHFIQLITVALDGATVITGHTSGAISRNPVFGFKLRGAKVGAKVAITWTDNRGGKRTDEVTVT